MGKVITSEVVASNTSASLEVSSSIKPSFFINKNEYTSNVVISSTDNAFFCGPINFTGTVEVNGVLNII